MGTSGMTSQAYGKHDLDEVARLFITVCRSRIAYRHYLSDIAISHPEAGIHFYTNYRGSRAIGYTLFPDLYMGAPAMLGLYGFAGWFIGMQNSRFPMYIAITQKYCEYCRKPLFRLPVPHESCRGSLGNTYSSICRFPDGIIIMEAILWRT